MTRSLELEIASQSYMCSRCVVVAKVDCVEMRTGLWILSLAQLCVFFVNCDPAFLTSKGSARKLSAREMGVLLQNLQQQQQDGLTTVLPESGTELQAEQSERVRKKLTKLKKAFRRAFDSPESGKHSS